MIVNNVNHRADWYMAVHYDEHGRYFGAAGVSRDEVIANVLMQLRLWKMKHERINCPSVREYPCDMCR